MKAKRNSLYLFLALACFVGIILIFIFDGYIGVYDRLVMDAGGYKQTIESDDWAQQERYGGMVSVGIDANGGIDFTYTVENHRFSAYSGAVDVSLWYNKVKTADLLARQLSVPAFNQSELTWTINAADLVSANLTTGQSYIFLVRITRGDIERDISVNIYASPAGIKTIPIPAPP